MSRPVQRAAQQEDAREHEEHEPDEPELGEDLHRQVVRLDRVVEVRRAVAQVQQVERAGAGSAQHVVGEAVPRLAPPGEAEVRARRADPAAVVADRTRADPVHRDRDDRRATASTPNAIAARRSTRVSLGPAQALEHERDDRTDDEQRAEHEPVAPADVQRLVVARHAGQREARSRRRPPPAPRRRRAPRRSRSARPRSRTTRRTRAPR